MRGQPNQVRPVTLSVNMKHRFFLLKICCVDSHLYYLWKAWHRWYVASKMAGIPYFSSHLTSWHSLLWWINQGLGSHFQAYGYRSLFFLSILRMVSSLWMDAYYPSKWQCIESDSSLLLCNKNHCQRDRNKLKSIKQEHVFYIDWIIIKN